MVVSVLETPASGYRMIPGVASLMPNCADDCSDDLRHAAC